MKEYKTQKITPAEIEAYARMVMDQIAKGQSISASIISVGIYILLKSIENPTRTDLLILGLVMVLSSYAYNYYRAKKKIQQIRGV
ncbi:MAG: hypothetical protein H5T41_09865 [Methanomassiliicoccales archaeon]|jgi:hypothetical protein|nr:hypothetical protein [Methanomassiliicoccales archaeon]